MKVVILHPPLYPVNHEFFNELGKQLNLVVYSFGSYPGLHKQWEVKNLINTSNNYQLKVIHGKANLKRKSVAYRTQLNPNFLLKIKKEKPNVVISIAFWFPSLYMALLKKAFKCKFLILTDAIKQTENNNSLLRKIIRNLIANQTDAFIACSNLTETFLKEQFPKTIVKKSFQTIDVLQWKQHMDTLPSKAVLRKNLSISKNKIVILSVGNFIPLKNLKILISQVPLIPNCELILVGEGPLKATFENQIKTQNLEHKIKLLPHLNHDELKQYYKACDIFIFPTNRDTFGYVVLEALASGKPVLCSKNSGASSIVEEGINGLIIDPKKNVIEPIEKVIQNLTEMQANTYKSVMKYTLQNRANEFMEIIKTVNYDS